MNKLLDRVPARALALVLALLLAVIAVVALSDYVDSQRREVTTELDLREVVVATQDIPAGTPAEVVRTLSTTKQIPLGALPDGALIRLDNVTGFLAQDVVLNQVFTTAMFVEARPAQNAFQIPPGQVAVAVDVSVTAGVANFLDPGDRVSILVNVGGARADAGDGTAADEAATRFLLQNVEVLAIGRRVTNAAAEGVREQVVRDDTLLTLTLAVDAFDAERLVYATTSGELYLVLLPDDLDGFQPTTTPGRNADNLFDR